MRILLLMFILVFSSFAFEVSPAQLELLKQSGYQLPNQAKTQKVERKKQVIKNEINISDDYKKDDYKKDDYKKDDYKKDDYKKEKRNFEKLNRFAANFFQNSNKLDPYSVPIPSNYKIARGDVLSLDIYGATDKSFKLSIDRKGSVIIPQVGELKLLGLSFEEAKEYIITKVKDAYPSNTSILVNIDEFSAIQVTLSGLVTNPGLYNLSSFSTIKDALIASGGILPNGSYRTILLKRAGKIITNYDLYALVKYGNTSLDTMLQTGDVVYVKPVQKEISVSGAITIPGIFELKSKDSFKKLISYASGLKPKANKKAIRLKRFLNNSSIKVYTLSLSELYRYIPKNGDELYFPSISEQSANYITLSGNVTNAGAVEIPTDKRLSSLFKNLFKDFGRNGIFKKDTNYAFAKVENADISKVFNLKELLKGKDEIYLEKGDNIIIYKLSEFKDRPFFYVTGDIVADTVKKEYDYYTGLKAKDLFSFVVFNNEISNKYKDKQKQLKFESEQLEDVDTITKNDEGILSVDKSKIQIKRVENNRYKSYTIDVYSNGNFPIKPYDVITFFSISEVSNPDVASIRGEVFIPKTYNISSHTTLNDMLRLAGGLTKKASKTRFELVRYKIVGDERVREVKTLNLKKALKNRIKIYPDDEITIRGIANWYEKMYVEIKGEVRYPGKYAVKKGEKLSSLIQRAGGFTKEAFIEGTVFTREQVKRLQTKRLKEALDRLRKKSLYASATPTSAGENASDKLQMASSIKELEQKVNENKPIGRIAIHIYYDQKRFQNSPYDIVLEDKDSLFVPTMNDTVSVVGEVLNQNTFVYNPKYSIKDYINRAGGETDIADSDMIYVVKANGDAIRYKKSYFFSDNIEVFKGDTIVVPFKLDTISDIKYAKDVTSIIYQLAVTAASLKTLGAL